MAEVEMKKPASFMSSVMSGMTGYVKGALGGGLIGAVGGALVGALVAGVSLLAAGASGGLLPAFGILAASAGTFALGGAAAGAALGSTAGMITGVVRSREANQPTAQDIVNVAKISFSQGVQVGAHVEQQQAKMKHTVREDNRRTAMPEHHSLQ